MALFLQITQTLVLVAALALAGQGLVGVFNWPQRRNNLLYRLFELIARPVVKLFRLITPKVVLDRHIPVGTFLFLVFAYFWLGFEHRQACKGQLEQPACEKWAAAWNQQTPR